ncbi:hypothetical protein AAMO2058_000401800 [Amorphochlora amoebiformis]
MDSRGRDSPDDYGEDITESKLNDSKTGKRQRQPKLFGRSGSGRQIRRSSMGGFSFLQNNGLNKHVVYKDMPYHVMEDYMHTLVGTGWMSLLVAIVVLVFLLVTIFGFLFWLTSDHPRSWWDSYNLAIQTWCTIGYGVLAPSNHQQEFIAVLTTFFAFLFTAVCTGLAFVKFSLPYAGMVWAEHCCISKMDGKYCLLVRAAKIHREEKLVDCKFQMFVIAPRASKEGYVMLTSEELKLRNPNPLSMGPSFTLIHELGEQGAVRDLVVGNDDMLDFVIVVRLMAYSMNFQSDVASAKFYVADNIKVNYRFQDIMEMQTLEGSLRVLNMDLDKLSCIEKVVRTPKAPRSPIRPPKPHRRTPPITRTALCEIHSLGRMRSVPSLPAQNVVRSRKDRKIERRSSGENQDTNPDSRFTPVKHIHHGQMPPLNELTENGEEKDNQEHWKDMFRFQVSPRMRYLRRQVSFRRTSLSNRKYAWYLFRCLRNVHWSDNSSKRRNSRFRVNLRGQSWWVRLHPNFWFADLSQGRWWVTVLVLFFFYITFILLFAILMYADSNSLSSEDKTELGDEVFLPFYWWSHHTLSTVGYGTLTENNGYGSFLVTLEGILGSVILALMAGVTWAKFAGIQPRILWSDVAVVCQYDGKPHLMVRCASLWKGHLIIDEESPLVSILPKAYRKDNGLELKEENGHADTIICVIEAFDGLFQQTVISRFRYVLADVEDRGDKGTIQIGYKFDDVILQDVVEHKVVVDYSKFHDISTDLTCKLHDYQLAETSARKSARRMTAISPDKKEKCAQKNSPNSSELTALRRRFSKMEQNHLEVVDIHAEKGEVLSAQSKGPPNRISASSDPNGLNTETEDMQEKVSKGSDPKRQRLHSDAKSEQACGSS